jgi:uncharacterized protein YoxC
MNELSFIGLIFDGLIIALLIAAIAYAIRLTQYLKRFKESRSDLEAIIKDLSIHIEKADKATTSLRESVEASADDLRERMSRANKMFDELDIVVQTGDALASRLENLASRNRRIIEGNESDIEDLQRGLKTQGEPKKQKENSLFAIRDREMEDNSENEAQGMMIEDEELLSEAERDLYNAMRQKGKR